MSSIKVITLGCKLNALESEAYSQVIGNRYQVTGEDEKPSIIIVNTCTVTSKADQKARRVIRKALRDYPEATVIVTGCYAELEAEEIKRVSRRPFAISDRKDDAEAQRLRVLKREEVLKYLNNGSVNSVSFGAKFEFFPEKFSKHTRSFLKIQDGCDNHCTYCRIRLARGKSVSLPAEQVLERLRILEQSHAEVVLTGVNISQYCDEKIKEYKPRSTRSFTEEDGELKLKTPRNSAFSTFKLLEYLLSNTEKIAIRLSSLDPQFIVENLFTVHCSLFTNNRIRPHFHLSIQSCSDKILRRMGRSYNAQIIENAVSFLRSVKDDPFLACDIITGFPGETEDDFLKTYELLKKIGFAHIHVFPYSKRPGTAAFDFKDKVKDSEISGRVKLLTELSIKGKKDYIERWLGREVEVIVQGAGNRDQGTESSEQIAVNNEQGKVIGLTENYLKVLIQCEGKNTYLPNGTVLRCRLTEHTPKDNDSYDAIAELTNL